MLFLVNRGQIDKIRGVGGYFRYPGFTLGRLKPIDIVLRKFPLLPGGGILGK